MTVASLAIFAGLSLNLLIQFALGAVGVFRETHNKDSSLKKDPGREIPFVQLGILFVSVFFLWVLFNAVLPGFWRGFSEFFLYFPFSALFCISFEILGDKVLARFFPRAFPQSGNRKKVFSAFTAYEGLVPASLMITSAAAAGFGDAFVLSLFFALGNLAAMLILNEIRRRASLEWIPRYLRGRPLVVISMGLLSLIFSSVAAICFMILGAF